jgi:glycosyltransferase involved in cell wall biosynthesis
LIEKGYDTNVLTIDKNPVKIEGAKYFTFPQKLNEASNRFIYDVKYVKFIYGQRNYIRKIIKEIEPDILHGGWIPAHGFISALSGFHPFLLMPWGSDVLVIPQNASYLTKKQIIWTIKKADMIQCNSKIMKNRINDLYGYQKDKMVVFPWGIDLEKFNPKVNGNKIRAKLGWKDKKILIMTRSFQKIYGIEYFLRSLPELVKKNDNTRVLFCGDGPLKNDFENYISENGLREYVYFVGHVENDDMPKYLAVSDIYVSTSFSDSTSISLLEAMACGLPLVVTNIDGNKDWITDGHNGFLVPKEDSYAVYEKLNLLLNDNDLSEKFGRRNLEIARDRADWNKNFGKLEEIYDKLLAHH